MHTEAVSYKNIQLRRLNRFQTAEIRRANQANDWVFSLPEGGINSQLDFQCFFN